MMHIYPLRTALLALSVGLATLPTWPMTTATHPWPAGNRAKPCARWPPSKAGTSSA